MKDRFTNGFIAGLLGGVIIGILDLVLYSLGVVQIPYLDWASVLIFGYRFTTLLEAAISQLGQLLFSAVAGVLFAYLLSLTSSRYYLFKGWVYGLVVWFGTYSITLLFKVTPLIPIKPDTVISHIVTASVYGLVLAESLRRLSRNKV
jgi:thiamine transporter ThiT